DGPGATGGAGAGDSPSIPRMTADVRSGPCRSSSIARTSSITGWGSSFMVLPEKRTNEEAARSHPTATGGSRTPPSPREAHRADRCDGRARPLVYSSARRRRGAHRREKGKHADITNDPPLDSSLPVA